MVTNNNRNVRSQLYWNTLMRLPSQGINFVISIIVARILMPRDFGIMGIPMILVGYCNLITNFGFNDVIIQRCIQDRKTLNSIFSFDLTISTIAALLFLFISEPVAHFFGAPESKQVIRVLSLLFVLTSFSGLAQAMLRRDLNFKTISLLDSGRSLLMSTLTLVLALNHFGYWSLVYGQLFPLFLTTILLCVKARWLPKICYNHSALRKVFNFGMWNFIKTQVEFAAQNIDKLIIGRWLGPVNLGFYDKALSIAEVPYSSVTMNINSVMFSSFSAIKEEREQLRQHFKKSMTLISFINFPIYLGIVAVAPHFVRTLMGEKWIPMILPFQIVLIGFLVKSFHGLSGSLNVALGKYKHHTTRLLVALSLFVLGFFVFLRFGIMGISLNYLFFSFIQTYLFINLSLRNIGLLWKDVLFAISPASISSLSMFLFLEIVSRTLFSPYTGLSTLCIVILGTAWYLGYLLLDNSRLTSEFKDRMFKDVREFLIARFATR